MQRFPDEMTWLKAIPPNYRSSLFGRPNKSMRSREFAWKAA